MRSTLFLGADGKTLWLDDFTSWQRDKGVEDNVISSFRWYGEQDPVSLAHIRQIPGVKGIVTALYDIPVGEVWSIERIGALRETVQAQGLDVSVIESVPVHEDIKLGKNSRDKYIENFQQTLRNLAEVGIKTVCYNFMPVFDWTRSDLSFKLPDGSSVLSYDEATVQKMDPRSGSLKLPGWDTSYSEHDLQKLLEDYQSVAEAGLWSNLEYFLLGIMPTAEEVGIRMAIHPDDPPWSVFGLPRIITDRFALLRVIQIYDSPANGLCICSGSLGANPDNDVPGMMREFGLLDRANFVHARNVKVTGPKSFYESGHLSSDGDVDMYEFVRAMYDVSFEGPIRPDHGRMIWDENGRPGYGLFDRSLGSAYLNGLIEAITKQGCQ